MNITGREKSVTTNTRDRTEQRSGYFFVLIFILLAISITAIGYFSYRYYQKQYRAEVEHSLCAIVNAKIDALLNWRKERIGDASIFFKNPVFTSLVQSFLENPKNVDTYWRIQTWIGKVQANSQYDQARLLDTQGVTILSVPANRPPVSSAVLQRLPKVLRSGQVTFQDFYRNDYDQHIYLAILVPILDEKNHNRPLAVLSLRINPEVGLYSFIQSWPTDSKTAETLLVRREGNSVLYLNELRFQKDTALKLKFSLDQKEIPAVKAVLGREGIVNGKDYRGVPVVSYVRAVPDSPWFLVTRMDTSEVYAPARERLRVLVGFVIILFFGAAAVLFLLQRQQNLHFYRKQYQMEDTLRVSEERYRILFDRAADGIIIMSLDEKNLKVNESFARIHGYSPQEMAHMRLQDLDTPETFQLAPERMRRLMAGEALVFEVEHYHKDGHSFPLSVSCNVVRIEGQLYFLGFHRDITERKKAEKELDNVRNNLLNILDNMDALVYVSDMETRELLYMNKFGRDIWGEDYTGKKCWQVIQKEQSGPCEFCTNDKLLKPDGSPAGVYAWKFQNTKNNRWYDCRDSAIKWFDGRTVRMEIATDITEHKRTEEEIKKLNTELEKRVALRTSQFLNANLELSKEMAVRKEYEEKLKSSLAEKELLLKEVNHRVKNNLQTISGILGLQIMQTKNEEVAGRLKNAQERVNSMALLQGMLHQANNLNEINFEEYIKTLAANLSYSHLIQPAELEMKIRAPGIFLDINTAIPCGLIINELMTNSLRHAFRDRKERKIWLDFNLDCRNDSYVISLRDNGIGLSEDFDSKKANTLGLQLIEGLTKQLNGTMVFQNNGGAQFTITFPKSKKEVILNG